MMKNKIQTTVVSLVTIVFLTIIDQWTKWLAVVNLKGQQPIVLIPGVFELSYVENRGAAFGMMQDQRWFFLIVTSIVLVGIIYLFFRMPFTRHYAVLRTVVVIFIAGAIGNLIDRVLLGYVVDFFYFSLIDFPVFNVADCYVTCTLAVFVVLILFKYKEEDLAFIPGMCSKKADKEKADQA